MRKLKKTYDIRLYIRFYCRHFISKRIVVFIRKVNQRLMKYKYLLAKKEENLITLLNDGWEILVEIDGILYFRKKKINLWVDITLFLIVMGGLTAIYLHLPSWIKH